MPGGNTCVLRRHRSPSGAITDAPGESQGVEDRDAAPRFFPRSPAPQFVGRTKVRAAAFIEADGTSFGNLLIVTVTGMLSSSCVASGRRAFNLVKRPMTPAGLLSERSA